MTPHFWPEDFPGEPDARVSVASNLLSHLVHCVSDFERALELAEYCDDLYKQASDERDRYPPPRPPEAAAAFSQRWNQTSAWHMMAARSTAITLDGFDEALDALTSTVKASPVLARELGETFREVAKAEKRRLKDRFPHIGPLRNRVAHAGEHAGKIDSHRVGGLFLESGIDGNGRFFATVSGRHVEYHFNRESLVVLKSILESVLRPFRDLKEQLRIRTVEQFMKDHGLEPPHPTAP